jgi:hypothetical protein
VSWWYALARKKPFCRKTPQISVEKVGYRGGGCLGSAVSMGKIAHSIDRPPNQMRAWCTNRIMQTHKIICDVCASYATRFEIEVIGPPGTPSEFVDDDSWIRCPKCGPRKQRQRAELSQKATIEFFLPVSASHSAG